MEAKDLYTKDDKTVVKKMKDTNKWPDNTTLSDLQAERNPYQIPVAFAEIEKPILKLTESRDLKYQNYLEEEECGGRARLPDVKLSTTCWRKADTPTHRTARRAQKSAPCTRPNGLPQGGQSTQQREDGAAVLGSRHRCRMPLGTLPHRCKHELTTVQDPRVRLKR